MLPRRAKQRERTLRQRRRRGVEGNAAGGDARGVLSRVLLEVLMAQQSRRGELDIIVEQLI